MVSLEDVFGAIKDYATYPGKVSDLIHPDKASEFVHLIIPALNEISNLTVFYPVNLFDAPPATKTEIIFAATDNVIYRGRCANDKFIYEVVDPDSIHLHLEHDGNRRALHFLDLNFQENKTKIEDIIRMKYRSIDSKWPL